MRYSLDEVLDIIGRATIKSHNVRIIDDPYKPTPTPSWSGYVMLSVPRGFPSGKLEVRYRARAWVRDVVKEKIVASTNYREFNRRVRLDVLRIQKDIDILLETLETAAMQEYRALARAKEAERVECIRQSFVGAMPALIDSGITLDDVQDWWNETLVAGVLES